ncbi:hypothetical protein D3C71_1271910 [compost metagenome]
MKSACQYEVIFPSYALYSPPVEDDKYADTSPLGEMLEVINGIALTPPFVGIPSTHFLYSPSNLISDLTDVSVSMSNTGRRPQLALLVTVFVDVPTPVFPRTVLTVLLYMFVVDDQLYKPLQFHTLLSPAVIDPSNVELAIYSSHSLSLSVAVVPPVRRRTYKLLFEDFGKNCS